MADVPFLTRVVTDFIDTSDDDFVDGFGDVLELAGLQDLPRPGEELPWETEVHGFPLFPSEPLQTRIPATGIYYWLQDTVHADTIEFELGEVDEDLVTAVRSGVFDDKVDYKLFWQLYRENVKKSQRVLAFPCQFGKMFKETNVTGGTRSAAPLVRLCTGTALPGRLVCNEHLDFLQDVGFDMAKLNVEEPVGDASIVVELTTAIVVKLKPNAFMQVALNKCFQPLLD